MPSLLYVDDKFVISGVTIDDNDAIKAIPGFNFNKKNSCWMSQADYKTYKQVRISFVDITISEEVEQWVRKHLAARERLKHIKNDPNVQLNNIISNKLYDYQRIDVNFMLKAERVINACDMGLAKRLKL